ncbi:MAG: hypothetical protein SNJ70_05270 [Armatimonadota bacterium]
MFCLTKHRTIQKTVNKWAISFFITSMILAVSYQFAFSDVSVAPDEVVKEVGIYASEVIPGNGTRAGYMLGNGGIIPDSETVYIGAKRAKKNVDYTIDYDSGSLYFTEAVRSFDSIRVDYKYSNDVKKQKTGGTSLAMPMNFSENMKLNLTYSYKAGDTKQGVETPDILTYGINSSLNFSDNASIGGLLYFSSPQKTNRLRLNNNTPVSRNKQTKEYKSDSLILQNLKYGVGDVKFNFGYQDVGEYFEGFSALRSDNAADADTLNVLEKEKGIKRLDFSAQMPTDESGAGLSMSFNTIRDKKDSIQTRQLAYNSSNYKISYMSRDVGKNFAKFLQIREADRAQLALEAGVSKDIYGLQFKTGETITGEGENVQVNPIWSGFTHSRLTSDTGSLSQSSLSLQFSNIFFDADIRDASSSFNRMAAVGAEERTKTALAIRKQFDPNAEASAVTAQDLANFVNESGLDRKNYALKAKFGNIDTSLGLSLINSDSGGLKRTSFNAKGEKFNLYYRTRNIDKTFTRIAHLQPIEILNYGNEYGMTRDEFGANFEMFNFKTSFTSADVKDYTGAGMLRQNLNINSDRFSFNANIQNIDKDFNRLSDIIDSDKASLVSDIGFSSRDYTLNYKVTDAISFDTYDYSSNNDSIGEARHKNRTNLRYAPTVGPKVHLFRDSVSYTNLDGNIISRDTERYTIDHSFNIFGGTQFRAVNETSSEANGNNVPLSINEQLYRFVTNPNMPTSFSIEYGSLSFSDGRFSENKGFSLKTNAFKNISLIGSYNEIDKDYKGVAETSYTAGIDWLIREASAEDANDSLNLSYLITDRLDGPYGTQMARQFSLNGLLAKNFLIFDNIRVGKKVDEATLRGVNTKINNSFKLEAQALGSDILIENSEVLNTQNRITYNSKLTQIKTKEDPNSIISLSYTNQEFTTQTGQPIHRHDYGLNWKISDDAKLTYKSYAGKDGQNGVVLPMGGSTLTLSQKINPNTSLFADYSEDKNDVLKRHSNTKGLGIKGQFSNKAGFEFYYGWTSLTRGENANDDNVFRIKYDHRIASDKFIILSAEKKSPNNSIINQNDGDTTARLDFVTTFD